MIPQIPDAVQLSKVFNEAAAPAFFLGAVTGLVSILQSRMSGVMATLREAHERKSEDKPILLARVKLLHSSIRLAMLSGLATSLLLAVSFFGASIHANHVYGASLLFALATGLVGGSLFQFFREIDLGLREIDPFIDPPERDGPA